MRSRCGQEHRVLYSCRTSLPPDPLTYITPSPRTPHPFILYARHDPDHPYNQCTYLGEGPLGAHTKQH